MSSISRTRCLASTLALLLAWLPSTSPAQAVRGRVLSDLDGKSVAAANITVLAASGEKVVSRISRDGTFLFDIPEPGSYRLLVEALGYRTLTSSVLLVPAGTMLTVELRLHVSALALEPLKVVAARIEPWFMRDLRLRQRDGWGHLISREQLDDAIGSNLSDVLMSTGLRMESVPIGEGSSRRVTLPTVTRTEITRKANCYSALYVNGVRQFPTIGPEVDLYRADETMAIRPYEIEAIEVYKSRIEAPAIYADTFAACGVVALWLRSGVERALAQDSLLRSIPVPHVTLNVGGVSMWASGAHAPTEIRSIEVSGVWQAFRAVQINVLARRSSGDISSANSGDLTQRLDPRFYRVPPGPRPLTVWTVGVEPRLQFRRQSRIRPLIGGALLAARRSFSVEPRAVQEESPTFSSSGWGIGATAGATFDVFGWLSLELAGGVERLNFGAFRQLEGRTFTTAGDWSANYLRLSFSKPLWTSR